MAISNKERITKSLGLLREALVPFVERQLRTSWGQSWQERVIQSEDIYYKSEDSIQWDTQLLLNVIIHNWNEFGSDLPRSSRNTAHALIETRNSWAHERYFSSFATQHALGNIRKLLEDIRAKKQLAEVIDLYNELQRTVVSEENRVRVRGGSKAITTTDDVRGKSWRSLVTPHEDVLAATFTEAEFAADLGQVSRGEARAEYGDPAEFFKRTFLTVGLTTLLTSAVQRFADQGGDPVIELQTGFGGGKTHSMLALYHLSGAGPEAKNLQGVDDLLRRLQLTNLPEVGRAVFVGTMRGVSDITVEDDGTKIHTMWGDLAWQLCGREGYELVADADREGTSPGSTALSELLWKATPCLILVDEWLAFIRQLWRMTKPPSAGSFEANITFVQSLTEAARAVPGVVLVASLPDSDIEIGGEGGAAALKRLESVFGRMESPWRAATGDESFEIVRRRLFEPITDPQKLRDRDRTIEEFWTTYKAASREFPQGCGEADYKLRMQNSYPIHPSLFDQLYQDWGSLDRFQRTRGVLRMIATIVRLHWENNDESRMILPSMVSLDNSEVQAEIAKSLDRDWSAVLDKDVDGPNSTPRQIDSQLPNLGRLTATRRVARCIFMGTAPTFETGEHPGIDERQVRLGCTQPGERHSHYGDALRRLAENATFLYQDDTRTWFATKASVAKIAQDRASGYTDEAIAARALEHLQEQVGRGDFDGVHVSPQHSADVPDSDSVRLVVLGSQHTFGVDEGSSEAHRVCRDYLLNRGSAQRRFRNMLVFVAPDEAQMASLNDAVGNLLAWESIVSEKESLNLDPQQSNLAQQRKAKADETVRTLIPEVWRRVLRPEKVDAEGTVSWHTFHLSSSGKLADRVSQRLIQEEQLLTTLGPKRMLMVLDSYNLWRDQKHVSAKQVWEDLCSFLYLPRLRDRKVFLDTIKQAVNRLHNETFAFAQGFDEGADGYTGLLVEGDSDPWITLDDQSLLVQLKEALKWWDPEPDPEPDPDSDPDSDPDPVPSSQRFFGSVQVDPERLVKEAGDIANEVLTHLTTKPGVQVEVSLEINAVIPQGLAEDELRVIRENCSTLKFASFDFEQE